MDREPASRVHTGLTALVLVVLAFVFTQFLIYDDGDDAYLGMIMISSLLVLTAVPFALSTVLPKPESHLKVLRLGLMAVAVTVILGTLILLAGLSALDQYNPRQQADLRESHLLGLLALIPSGLVILGSYYLRSSNR